MKKQRLSDQESSYLLQSRQISKKWLIKPQTQIRKQRKRINIFLRRDQFTTITKNLENIIFFSQNQMIQNLLYHFAQLMIKPHILLACLLATILTKQQPFKKIIHNSDPKAKCVDGSPPAIYIHQGNQPNNFIIFFNGGGACFGTTLSEVIESCYQRSKTDLGSSKYLKDEIIIDGGYLSTDPQKSKFASWTKVLIEYCDGAMHQGSNEGSIKYKDAELFFRGAYNTRSHFKYLLDNYNFKSAEKVVLTGSSAGGVATALWTNHVRSLLANPNAMVSIPDSGVFMNVASPETGIFYVDIILKTLYKLSNTDEKPPNNYCNRAKAGEEYKCFFLEVLFTSLEGRVMIIHSQYDSTTIPLVLTINCIKNGTSGSTLSGCNSSQLANIQVYRKAFLNFASNFMQFSKNNIWTIACSHHVYAIWGQYYESAAQKVPANTGLTVREAVQNFVFKGERISLIDRQNWPGNSPCAY